MTEFWLRLWHFTRRRAIKAIAKEFPGEYEDARRVWRMDAHLGEILDSPAWITDGLADDLALHDAASSLLGENHP